MDNLNERWTTRCQEHEPYGLPNLRLDYRGGVAIRRWIRVDDLTAQQLTARSAGRSADTPLFSDASSHLYNLVRR